MVAGQAVSSEAETGPASPLYRAEVHARFAAALRDGMAATALRQRELANRVGVSPGRISQYLNDPKKMPARWERIVELLAAAGAPVEEFSERYGSFWADHPGPSPDPAATPDGVDDPEPANNGSTTADRAPGDSAVTYDEGSGQDDGGPKERLVEVSEALEAATMADANAARTGLVLSTPVPVEPAGAAPPAVETSLEVATELAVPAVPPRPENQLLPLESGRFPVPRPAPPASLNTPAPIVSGNPEPSSGQLAEQVHVEEEPTGPIPTAKHEASRAGQFLGGLSRSFLIAAVLLVVVVVGIVVAVAVPGSPRVPATVAPAPEPLMLGVVEGAGGQGLTERTFPSKGVQHRTPRSLADGTPVAIVCGQIGDPVLNEKQTGSSTTWLRLQDGFWVTSVFVRINAASIASCTRGPALPLTLTPR